MIEQDYYTKTSKIMAALHLTEEEVYSGKDALVKAFEQLDKPTSLRGLVSNKRTVAMYQKFRKDYATVLKEYTKFKKDFFSGKVPGSNKLFDALARFISNCGITIEPLDKAVKEKRFESSGPSHKLKFDELKMINDMVKKMEEVFKHLYAKDYYTK